jgi:hypothetical protein
MILLAAYSVSLLVAAVVASLLMVAAGIGEKRLRWQAVKCPVCHHRRDECTCRWR